MRWPAAPTGKRLKRADLSCSSVAWLYLPDSMPPASGL